MPNNESAPVHFIFYHHEAFGPFSLEQLHRGEARYGGSVARLRILFWIAARGQQVTLLGNVQPGSTKGVRAVARLGNLASVVRSGQPEGTLLVLNNLPSDSDWKEIVRFKDSGIRTIAWVGNHLNSRWLSRLARGELDRAVCVSRSHRERYRIYPGFERIEALYSGVDLDLLLVGIPTEFRNPTVLSVSIPRRSKGFHNLLEAWRKVHRVCPTARLRVCGSAAMHVPEGVHGKTGVLDPNVEEEFVDFFGNPPDSNREAGIDLMGARSLSAVYADLRGADVAIVNCNWRGSTETYCRSAVEAQMAGTPVVGAAAGSLPEVVASGKTGILVEQEDPEELANAIVTLLQDKALRDRMSAAGPSWAKPLADYGLLALDWERIADRALRGEATQSGAYSVGDFLRGVGYGRAKNWMRERLRDARVLDRDRLPS